MNVNDYAVVVLSRSDWECIKMALSFFGETSILVEPVSQRIIEAIREQTRREVSA